MKIHYTTDNIIHFKKLIVSSIITTENILTNENLGTNDRNFTAEIIIIINNGYRCCCIKFAIELIIINHKTIIMISLNEFKLFLIIYKFGCEYF